jgi:hypothetical protein
VTVCGCERLRMPLQGCGISALRRRVKVDRRDHVCAIHCSRFGQAIIIPKSTSVTDYHRHIYPLQWKLARYWDLAITSTRNLHRARLPTLVHGIISSQQKPPRSPNPRKHRECHCDNTALVLQLSLDMHADSRLYLYDMFTDNGTYFAPGCLARHHDSIHCGLNNLTRHRIHDPVALHAQARNCPVCLSLQRSPSLPAPNIRLPPGRLSHHKVLGP